VTDLEALADQLGDVLSGGEDSPRLRELKEQIAEQALIQARAEATSATLALENTLASADQNRILYIHDAIMDTRLPIMQLNLWARRDPGEPITISINTPGGSLFDGNALLETIQEIRSMGTKIITIGTGMVASYGAVLLQAGDERILTSSTIFMVHGLSAESLRVENLHSLGDTKKMLDGVEDRMITLMAKRSKLTKRAVKAMITRKDAFMSANEALEKGFCDRVI